MKKRIRGILLAALAGASLLAMAGSVSAATAVYVPKKVTTYRNTGSGWWKYSVETTEYNADKAKTRTVQEYYDTDKTDVTSVRYTYNKKGQLTRLKEYTGKKRTAVTTYTYKNDVLSKSVRTADGAVYTTTYTYKKKNVVKEETKKGKKDYSVKTYTYKSGRLAREKTVYSAGGTEEYSYTYDKKGRLTKYIYKYTYKNGKTERLTYEYSKFDKHKNYQKQVCTYRNTYGENSKDTTTLQHTYTEKGTLKQTVATTKFADGNIAYWKYVYSSFMKQ